MKDDRIRTLAITVLPRAWVQQMLVGVLSAARTGLKPAGVSVAEKPATRLVRLPGGVLGQFLTASGYVSSSSLSSDFLLSAALTLQTSASSPGAVSCRVTLVARHSHMPAGVWLSEQVLAEVNLDDQCPSSRRFDARLYAQLICKPSGAARGQLREHVRRFTANLVQVLEADRCEQEGDWRHAGVACAA